MAEPISIDLRTRVVEAVIGGMSRRRVADHFKVGMSSAIRSVARALGTGDPSKAQAATVCQRHRG
jgi:transposase